MDDKKDTAKLSASGTTLRRPVKVVKKRSGPLDDALNELYQELNEATAPPVTQPEFTVWQPTSTDTSLKLPSFAVTAASPQPTRRRPTIKEKEKKRERWLLTRKTWKYMTDAGRKLIPEGAQNRKEDIPKIEAHFQHICANEPRFILWRRKSSYPGAVRNSKRRLKHLLQHTGHKGPNTIEALEQEEAYNADRVIDLLQSYLKLDEVCKTTTLLSSKTVRPDQTASPSARRPCGFGKSAMPSGSTTSRGASFFTQQLPKDLQELNEIDQLIERLRRLFRSATGNVFTIPTQDITPAILEDKVLLKQIYNTLKKQQLHRVLSTHSTPLLKNTRANIRHASSMSSLLNFGAGVSSALKFGGSIKGPDVNLQSSNKDQLAFSAQSDGPPTTVRNIATIPTVATTTGAVPKKPLRSNAKGSGASPMPPSPAPRQRKPPNTLNLAVLSQDDTNKAPTRRVRQPPVVKYFNSCGTQTNFIPLQEIKRLAEEYKELKREEAALSGTPGATDDETEKGIGSNTTAGTQHQYCRKSSIDNEDVSQSVSDTIKRYLRMARKKSVNDDNANRFKRVNYDRNLRNIKAKGEINPPGMDEDNSKAVQTLDGWPVICLDFIRGNETSCSLEVAHAEWQRALNERTQKKLEYDQKFSRASVVSAETLAPAVSSCGSASAPTSPTSPENFGESQHFGTRHANHGFGSSMGGLRLAGSQFLSNLWHGTSSSVTATPEDEDAVNSSGGGSFLKFHRSSKHDPSARTNDTATKDAILSAAMQKSKSSSNVGQFVTRKILKSRSKSQSRPNTQATIPKWAPAEKHTWTSENGDRFLVQDSCLQNLTDIEAKILQRVAIEKISELNIGVNVLLNQDSKPQKRRVLAKKKAMTTSFFDISKKDEQSGHGLFGNSLECCVVNDKKRGSSLKVVSERGSRNSIAALFRGGGGNEATNKLHENVRSYESLPSSTFSLATPPTNGNSSRNGSSSAKSSAGYFCSLSKSTSMQMQISRSQSDVRRHSQELDLHEPTYYKEQSEVANNTLQVPTFITACIKYLEDHGLHQVGLFRVSTSKKRVKQMREDFDKNIVTDIRDDTCPHDVATLLKEFLRDLPEPLLCSGLYKAFLETQRIRNRRLQLEAISHLVKLLPAAHRDTLYVVLKFLARVASCSDDVWCHDGNVQVRGNRMDSNNLATVFAPNILRTNLSNSSSADAVSCANSIEQESMNDAINVIRIMIDHYEEIFKVPAELIDIVYSHMLDVCPDHLYSICEQRIQSIRDDIGNSCSSLNSTEQSLSPLSTTAATNISASNVECGVGAVPSTLPAAHTTAKRLYTRESVMHDNDACRVTEAAINGSHDGKRSSSSSRHSMTQKLRHDSRKGKAANSDMVDRRQSSPNIYDKSGIVSASLQIQVPVAQASHLKLTDSTTRKKSTPLPDEQTTYDLDEVFYKSGTIAGVSKTASSHILDQLDYTDIPYFEDETNTRELENLQQYIPIAGSLSIATKIEGATKDYRQVHIVQQQQIHNNRTGRSRLQSTTQQPTVLEGGQYAAAELDASTQSCADVAYPSKYDLLYRKKPENHEPKSPASISNIGGAILRSKTADFEKMSLNNQTMQRLSTNTPSIPDTSMSPAATTTPHLYKRQELIQSAKHGKGKK